VAISYYLARQWHHTATGKVGVFGRCQSCQRWLLPAVCTQCGKQFDADAGTTMLRAHERRCAVTTISRWWRSKRSKAAVELIINATETDA
jgi:hypothetical protein